MDLQPIARRSVADAVHDQLLDAILGGAQPAGSTLPSERDLAASAGVNRQAVREALQRLRQADLVEIVHGGGVRVLDWRRSAGLALLPALLLRGEGLDPVVGRSIMELRVTIGADAARCCAERTPEASGAALLAFIPQMATAGPDAASWGDLGWRYWETVIDGADNVAYRLAFNTLRAVADAVAPVVGGLVGAERGELARYEAVAVAVSTGQAEAAAVQARAILQTGLRLATALLEGWERHAPAPS